MLLRRKTASQDVTIELAPMIDMVFLLLIFFLVATTLQQTEREMKIVLPEASASGPISVSLREIVINVDEQGTIVVGGQAISAQDLRGVIEEAVQNNPEQKVSVRGDRRAAYEHIVAVLDICKASGIQEPFLDTVLGET